jgi:hypothetical protein
MRLEEAISGLEQLSRLDFADFAADVRAWLAGIGSPDSAG